MFSLDECEWLMKMKAVFSWIRKTSTQNSLNYAQLFFAISLDIILINKWLFPKTLTFNKIFVIQLTYNYHWKYFKHKLNFSTTSIWQTKRFKIVNLFDKVAYSNYNKLVEFKKNPIYFYT